MARKEVKEMHSVVLEEVNRTTLETYIKVGTQSYCEHYLHLWENRNPSPYLESSFTKEVVLQELENPNSINFLVKSGNAPAGIVKLIIDEPIDEFSAEEALLAQKIYLLKSFSGKGIGKRVLELIEDFAKAKSKKLVWLDTMKKGKPIDFYLKHGYSIKKESELKLAGAITAEKPMWVLTKRL